METKRLLAHAFLKNHPDDSARILEQLPAEESAAVLEEAQPSVAAAVLQKMAPLSGVDYLGRISLERGGAILASLSLDIAVGLLRRMESQARNPLLDYTPSDVSNVLRLLLQYPEGTAGALMDPRVPALPDDIPVHEALAHIRRSPRQVFYYLYVVNRARVLVGALSLHELLSASPKGLLASIMKTDIVRLSARADRASIATHPGWKKFHTLPVVDHAGVFVGAIRYETFRRLEEEWMAGRQSQSVLSTVVNLGELCWIGMSGLLQSLTSVTMAPSNAQKPIQGSHRDK